MIFLRAWLCMIFIGMMHSSWHEVPAFGYWLTFCLAIIAQFAATPFARSRG